MRVLSLMALLSLAGPFLCCGIKAEETLPPVKIRMTTVGMRWSRTLKYRSPEIKQEDDGVIELRAVVTSEAPLILRRPADSEQEPPADFMATTDTGKDISPKHPMRFSASHQANYDEPRRFEELDNHFLLGQTELVLNLPEGEAQSITEVSGTFAVDWIVKVDTFVIEKAPDKLGQTFEAPFGTFTLDEIRSNHVSLTFHNAKRSGPMGPPLQYGLILEEGQPRVPGMVRATSRNGDSPTVTIRFERSPTPTTTLAMVYPSETQRVLIPFEFKDVPLTAEAMAKHAEAANKEDIPAAGTATDEARPAE